MHARGYIIFRPHLLYYALLRVFRNIKLKHQREAFLEFYLAFIACTYFAKYSIAISAIVQSNSVYQKLSYLGRCLLKRMMKQCESSLFFPSDKVVNIDRLTSRITVTRHASTLQKQHTFLISHHFSLELVCIECSQIFLQFNVDFERMRDY